VKPCPSCGADAGAPRVGSLGESKGVWCKQCGFATTTVGGWENRPTPGYDVTSPVWSLPATQPMPTLSYAPNAARKLFHNRKHGPLVDVCPGFTLLPLIDIDSIPADMLGVILDHYFGELWTDATSPQQKRDRLRALVT
jgi:hypothetical protein